MLISFVIISAQKSLANFHSCFENVEAASLSSYEDAVSLMRLVYFVMVVLQLIDSSFFEA